MGIYKQKKKKKLKSVIKVVISVLVVSIGIVSYIYASSNNKHKAEREYLLSEVDISCYTDDEYINNDSASCSNNSEEIKDRKDRKIRKGKDFITEAKERKEENNIINVSIKQSSSVTYTKDELELLTRLIYSEAGDEPYLGKVAVGNVVLYRCNLKKKSIKDIIFEKHQFDGVNTKWFSSEPNEESRQAALEVLEGKQVVTEAYQFANLKLCNPDWARKELFVCRIGDHWFFKGDF